MTLRRAAVLAEFLHTQSGVACWGAIPWIIVRYDEGGGVSHRDLPAALRAFPSGLLARMSRTLARPLSQVSGRCPPQRRSVDTCRAERLSVARRSHTCRAGRSPRKFQGLSETPACPFHQRQSTRADSMFLQYRGNPIDDARFFVRQHYLDFLLREPDMGGLGFWAGQITQCGTNQTCIANKRVDVSRAFWQSGEFRQQARTANMLNPLPPPEYNNGRFIDLSYRIYLQRAPNDPPDNNFDGYNFWFGNLNGCTNSGGDSAAITASSALPRVYRVSQEFAD